MTEKTNLETEIVEEKPTQPIEETPKVETTEEIKAELERTRKALKDANKEAADRRIKLSDYEAEEQKRKEAEMSEIEKLKAQLEQTEQKAQDALKVAQEREIRSTVIAEASKLNFYDPQDAYALLDRTAIADQDGKIDGVKEALEELVKNKPHLIKKDPVRAPGPTNPGGGGDAETDADKRRRLGL